MKRLVGASNHASRRRFMAAAGLGAASLVGSRIFPVQAADAGGALDLSKLPSEAEMWKDVVAMNDMGPRYTGNAAHQKFVTFLKDRIGSLGIAVEPIKHNALILWEPKGCGIKTASGKSIPIAFENRWSKVTGPQGVTAPVKFCGRMDGASNFTARIYPDRNPKIDIPADIRGKIALIEVMADPLPFEAMFKGHVSATVDPTNAGALPALQNTAWGWNTNESRLPKLQEELAQAGAVGVIYSWANGVDADAQGQYKRNGTASLPSLWVGHTAAQELRALGEQGGTITMTVDAKVTNNVATETIVATLPGQSDETIILWSHSDGMNAIEENGSVAVVMLMKFLASLPKSARQRTVSCVITEGHFATQFLPDQAWLKDRPDIVSKAITSVGMEHLGCKEWVGDMAKNSFTGSGKADVTWAFCLGPDGKPNHHVQVMQEALKTSRRARTVVVDRSENSFSPGLHPWRFAKIPSIGYIMTPAYFLAEVPNGHIDKLDSGMYFDQVQTLARATRILDTAPKDALLPV
jgi:hypothetical protein